MFSKKNLCLLAFLGCIGGIIFYGFYDEKIHIDYSIRQDNAPINNKPQGSLTFFHSKNNTLVTTTEPSSISVLDNTNLQNIVNRWLSHLFEYEQKLQKTLCHSLIIKNNIYYCSFTNTPFKSSTCMYEKYAFFEGLIHTLFALNPSLKGILFLINHQPFEDDDYDFTLPWSSILYK